MLSRYYLLISLVSLAAQLPIAWATPLQSNPQIDSLTFREARSEESEDRGGKPHWHPKPLAVRLKAHLSSTGIEWIGAVDVGTPSQFIPVVFDTSLADVVVSSVLCGKGCSNTVRFNPHKSKGFHIGKENVNATFYTGLTNQLRILNLQSGRDTVRIGGLSVPNADLFLVADATPAFPDQRNSYSGVIGLANAKNSFLTEIVKQGLSRIFGFYLAPANVGGAELTIGGIDSDKFKGDITYAHLSSNEDGFWTVKSHEISVNGKSKWELKNRQIQFNTAIPSIITSTRIAEAVYSLISKDIKPFRKEPGTYGIPCHHISSLPAAIDISLTSTWGKSFKLTIPSSEFNVGPFASDKYICQTLINAADELGDYFTVGGSLYKHFYVIHDGEKQRMGFAKVRSH